MSWLEDAEKKKGQTEANQRNNPAIKLWMNQAESLLRDVGQLWAKRCHDGKYNVTRTESYNTGVVTSVALNIKGLHVASLSITYLFAYEHFTLSIVDSEGWTNTTMPNNGNAKDIEEVKSLIATS